MKFLKLVLLALTITLTISAMIIPDEQNPLQMTPASSAPTSANLFLKFTLASTSSGLVYGQYIAVQFPQETGPYYKFDASTPPFTCTLQDSNNTTYSLTAVPSLASTISNFYSAEQYISYCKFTDITNTPLKVGSTLSYTLTIGLSATRYSGSFIRSVGLFTSTSNYPEKVIIDSIPVFGKLAQYGDWNGLTLTQPLAFSIFPTILISGGASTTIYPYNIFDISFALKVNAGFYISMADTIIIIQYPSDTVTAASALTSSATSSVDHNGAVLSGTLNLSQFSIGTTTSALQLTGVGEDLMDGRNFILTLKGWKALDTVMSVKRNLEIFVYYKNTYSVYSYITSNIFLVTPAVLTLSANHPEFWDIWRNGAWPIKFHFTLNSELTNGGYVTIQHTNAKDASDVTGNKISFVASTCDFSDNTTIVNNGFGQRPICFPMRLDQAYPGNTSSITVHSGSGIFFYMQNPLTIANGFYVNVWAYADNCGGSPVSNSVITTISTPGIPDFPNTNYVIPQFTVNVYRIITPTNINEARFNSANIIGTSLAASFNGKCWNNYIQSVRTATADRFDLATLLSITGAPGQHADYVMYREFTSQWDIMSTASIVYNVCTSCFMDNISVTSNFTAGFLYSPTSALLVGGSYFLMRLQVIRISSLTDVFHSVFPTNYYNINNPNYSQYYGRLVTQFSYKWFSPGLSYSSSALGLQRCLHSWALVNDTTFYKNTQYSLQGQYNNNIFNVIQAGGDIDDINSYIATNSSPTNSSTAFRITAKQYVSGGSTSYIYFADAAIAKAVGGSAATTSFVAGFFSSCVTWQTTAPSTIVSMYAYIDIQYRWEYVGATTYPLRNARFIKLFPESGIFHDYQKKSSGLISNPIFNHYGYGSSVTSNSVCLFELHTPSVVTTSDSNSPVLSLHIMWATLIETDYSDMSSTYPIGGLSSGVVAYGMQSAVPMNYASSIINTTSNGQLDQININQYATIIIKGVSILQSKLSLRENPTDTNSGAATSYQFYLGSQILFTGIKTNILGQVINSNQSNIQIPYYCPLWTNTSYGNFNFCEFPVISANWLTMSGFNAITSLNKFMTLTQYVNNNLYYNNIVPNIAFQGTLLNTAKPADTTASAPLLAILKWAGYAYASGSQPNINSLYVYNQKTYALCTAQWAFAVSAINFESNIFWAVSGATNQNTIAQSFYAFGKKFNKSVFYGAIAAGPSIPTPTLMIVNTSNDMPMYSWTGIDRPSIDTLSVNGVLGAYDKIAYFCASSDTTNTFLLTNYFYNTASPNNINNFILDFNPQLTAAWGQGSLTFDVNEVFKADVAGNFKITFTTPSSIPIGSSIIFSSTQLSLYKSTCGLIQASGISSIAIECSVSLSYVTCAIPNLGSTFSICCYNVNVVDSMTLNYLNVNFPLNPNIPGLGNYIIETTIYSVTNPFGWSTLQATLLDVINTKAATLSSVTYLNVQQDSGIGKAVFNVLLPRNLVRGSQIIINGDFSGMVIPGQIPRCLAVFSNLAVIESSYGSAWDNGDGILNVCSSNNISSVTKSITIQTKAMTYKCGLSFSKAINLILWPVITYNFSTSNNKYGVDMSIMSTNENVSLAGQTSLVSSITSYAAKPKALGQWDTLCTVTSVIPKIPAELADYTFTFDINTNKSALASPNEVTIFFPYSYYGVSQNDIMCYSGAALLNCSWTDDGILNVRFTQSLQTIITPSVNITITSIINPALDNNYSFPCTINVTNFATGVRLNQITGSGILAGGIQISSTTTMGNLRFMQADSPVADTNPRSTSTHQFKIAFDNAVALTKVPISLSGSPIFYIYFPTNYKLSWYNMISNTPVRSGSVDVWTYIPSTNPLSIGVVSKTDTIPVNLTISGNRIALSFTNTSYTIPSSFRFFQISLTNIQAPLDTTVQTLPKTQTTKTFYITLTNSANNYIYRTYTNVNSYVGAAFPVSSNSNANKYLLWNRGNSYSFDGKKWVIDFVTPSSTAYNVLTVKAGRYLQINIQTKSNTSSTMAPANANISLDSLTNTSNISSSSNFQLAASNYFFSTSFQQAVRAYIGVPCGTAPGSYIVYFSYTQLDTVSSPGVFSPLAPVQIFVDTSTTAIISYTALSNSVPPTGSTLLQIFISEPNVDALTISWGAGTGSVIDTTASLSPVIIPPGYLGTGDQTSPTPGVNYLYSVFSYSGSTSTSPAQNFQAESVNSCYSFQNNTVSFMTSKQNILDMSSALAESMFSYKTAVNDTNMNSKNSIKIIFQPTKAPGYLYAVMMCNQFSTSDSISWPSDTDIKALIIPSLNPDPSQFQYYYTYIPNATQHQITFSGLNRNQQYLFRFIMESVHADTANRTSSDIVIPTNSTAATPTPVPTTPIQCAQITFSSDPGTETIQALINYCQFLYSTTGSAGWSQNGCVICMDYPPQYNAFGPAWGFSTIFTGCSAPTSKKKLRFLQKNLNGNSGVQSSFLNSYVNIYICPVPHPVCATDVDAGSNSYFEIFGLFQTSLENVYNSAGGNATIAAVATLSAADANNADTVNISDVTGDLSGNVSWTAVSTVPYICYFQVVSTEISAPNAPGIIACTSISTCGSFDVSTTATTEGIDSPNSVSSGNYLIYFVCFNNVPFANQQSIVFSSKFTVEESNNRTANSSSSASVTP